MLLNCASQVAARCVETAVQGAVHNVTINLKEIQDEQFKRENSESAGRAVELAVESRDRVLAVLAERH